jgi:hypothetical protein
LLDAVWSDSVVSENSLARSIGLLRRLLGDDIHAPRFIATVATVGYRFIGEVEVAEDTHRAVEDGPAPIDIGSQLESPPLIARDARFSGRTLWWSAGTAVFLGLVVVALFVGYRSATPMVDGALQLTDDGNPKLLTTLASDGSRIYFNEIQEGREVIAQVAATGGRWGLGRACIGLFESPSQERFVGLLMASPSSGGRSTQIARPFLRRCHPISRWARCVHQQ